MSAAGPGGVLYHCQRGRERTGLLTLLLLSLVGVPDEVIVADQVHTDDRLRSHGIALGHEGLEGEADLYAEHGTTAETTLTALLSSLDVAEYLRDAGMTEDELAAIHRRAVMAAMSS